MKTPMPAPIFYDDEEDRIRQHERGFTVLLREVAACDREVARILRRQVMRKARGEDVRDLAMLEMETRHLANLRELAEMGRSLARSMRRPAIVRADRRKPEPGNVATLRAMRPASPSRH